MNERHEDAEYLSQEGFLRLKKELVNLKDGHRKEIAARLEYAKSLGDLSENAEYQEAKDEQLVIETRISELENILSRAVLISHTVSSLVDLGSTVKARKEGGREEIFSIVGSEEAEPSAKKISNESPLGHAFLGKKKGDTVTVYTPRGEIRYHILDII